MDVNLVAVFVCGVLSMVVGFVWYGPLFGKMWMKVIGATEQDKEKKKEMQKKAGPLYLVQFILTLFQVYSLTYLATCWPKTDMLKLSIFIWIAFIVPIIAGSSMWNNDSSKTAWTRFLIQAGYQLVMFVIYGLVLNFWL
ncbi:MAG: DUF1761 domain-containing protein [Patescibacteria group bacterium]